MMLSSEHIQLLNLFETKSLFTVQRYFRIQNYLRKKRKELIIICQHPPVITAGIQINPDHLLSSIKTLSKERVEYFSTKRAGGFTAHEFGQCVIYPNIDLTKRAIPISKYFHSLLLITQTIMKQIWNIDTITLPNQPGLYLNKKISKKYPTFYSKIVSAGIDCRSNFATYGFSININNSMDTFKHIIPCGQKDVLPVSIASLLGHNVEVDTFYTEWVNKFEEFLYGYLKYPSGL